MTVHFHTRTLLLTLVGLAVAGLTACTPVVKEEVDQTEVVTYKLVESGTLDVVMKGAQISTEEYSIEAGSDGNWVAGARVTSKDEGQPVRDIRMELTAAFKPVMYTEEAEGENPLKIFVSFQPEKVVFNFKQGEEPQQSKTVDGTYEAYADINLFHHHALIARAYLARQTDDQVEFTLVGGEKIQVKKAKPTLLELNGTPTKVDHLKMTLRQGKQKEDIWLKADDSQVLKVEAYRGALTATRADIPEAASLTSKKKEKTRPTDQEGEGEGEGEGDDDENSSSGDDN